MTVLGKSDILAFRDNRIASVEVAELGGRLHIGMLTVAESDRLAQVGEDGSVNAEIVLLGACDEEGKRLFAEKDREAVRRLPADVIRKVARAIMDHNGYNREVAEKNG